MNTIPPSFIKLHSVLIDYNSRPRPSQEDEKAARKKQITELYTKAILEMGDIDPDTALVIFPKLVDVKGMIDDFNQVENSIFNWELDLTKQFNKIFLEKELTDIDSNEKNIKGYLTMFHFALIKDKSLPPSSYILGRYATDAPNTVMIKYTNEKGEAKEERIKLLLDKKWHTEDGKTFETLGSFAQAMEKEKGIKGLSVDELKTKRILKYIY